MQASMRGIPSSWPDLFPSRRRSPLPEPLPRSLAGGLLYPRSIFMAYETGTPPGPLLPCRSSSRLHNFALVDRPSPGSGSRDDNSAYSRLLRAELFEGDSSPGGDKQDCPGSNNLFRFKTDPRSSAPSPSFAEKLDCVGAGGSPTPKKAPRKVPKMPHKVLDAPSLQDDFYLNLVDWSSQNMLAVGLGTCVYQDQPWRSPDLG